MLLQQSRINHPSHRQSNHVTIQPCRADAILNASGTRPVFSLGFIQKPDCGIYLFSVPCRGLDGLSDSSPRISRSRRINCISAPPIRGYTNFKEDSAVCVAGCFGAESNVSGSGLGPEYWKCSWVRGPRGAEYGVWRAPSPDIDQIDSSSNFHSISLNTCRRCAITSSSNGSIRPELMKYLGTFKSYSSFASVENTLIPRYFVRDVTP
jgi:hypothetical protein